MGMFDYLKCDYPLPEAEGRLHPECHWQTKDTPAQWMDHYHIRDDGALWHLAYDIETQSGVNVDSPAVTLAHPLRHTNERWEPCLFLGEIRFYRFWDEVKHEGWIEYSSYFVHGQLQHIHCIECCKGPREPATPERF